MKFKDLTERKDFGHYLIVLSFIFIVLGIGLHLFTSSLLFSLSSVIGGIIMNFIGWRVYEE